MPGRTRLDQLLVDRGLVDSRTRARALVIAGAVRVDGEVVSKAGTAVRPDVVITLAVPDHPYVGRGGVKLAHALDAFHIDPAGRIALDIGASTGGFTDVLLRRGARTVVALDVGHGQLAWKLRQDPRVVVVEGQNARYLEPHTLPAACRRVGLITIDVAFISLTRLLHRLPPLLTTDGDIVALVKPQFEAGRAEVGKGGVVTDPAVQHRVVEDVTQAADRIGLTRIAATASPIAGAEGNREFFLHLRPVGQ